MPTYEFECQKCRQTFELHVTFAEYAALAKAKKIAGPTCDTTKVIRVFSPPGIGSSSAAKRGSDAGCCPGGRCR